MPNQNYTLSALPPQNLPTSSSLHPHVKTLSCSPMENKGAHFTQNELGFYRLKQVLEIVLVSKSAWYAGILEGRFLNPIALGARASAWRKSDILALVRELSQPLNNPKGV